MTSVPPTFRVSPTPTLRGTIRPPGDKSISHRALLLSAMATGESTILGISHGDDVWRTAAAVAALGAEVDERDGVVHVRSTGTLRAAVAPLDCGNSGTGMRLLAGVVAAIPGRHVLVGDASLSSRPMDRVARPLEAMGATLEGAGDRLLPPLTVHGGQLHGVDYEVPEPSAQVKSAVILAALQATSPSTITEAVRTRTHTEEMLVEAGCDLVVVEGSWGRTIRVEPGLPQPHRWVVAADPSQAAFTAVAAAVCADGEVAILDLYPGVERIGFIDVLERMGASVERTIHDGRLNLTVEASSLAGTVVEAAEIPSLDEVPILAIAALRATGTTRFCDVGELRVKESDRLAATAALVRALGGRAEVVGDDLVVHGGVHDPVTTTVDPLGDHRLAMAAAIGALSAAPGSTVTVVDASCIQTSYPSFVADLESLGVVVEALA